MAEHVDTEQLADAPVTPTKTRLRQLVSQAPVVPAVGLLLVIAVGSERRTGKDKGTAARLRDLR